MNKYSDAEGRMVNTRVNKASSVRKEGQLNLIDCIVEAREKGGVTGSGLNDFMKYEGFQEDHKMLSKAAAAEFKTIDEAARSSADVKRTFPALTNNPKDRARIEEQFQTMRNTHAAAASLLKGAASARAR